MKSSDFLAASWPLGKDSESAEFYALKLGTDEIGNSCVYVTLYIKNFNDGELNREQIDGVANMDDTDITLYPKSGFDKYEEMLEACFDYVHSLNFTANDAELKKENGELWRSEILFNGIGLYNGPWEKVQFPEEEEQDDEKFAAEELNILSNVLISAIGNAGAAAKQIADMSVKAAIDDYVSMLQRLNSKICSMMED